MTELFTFLVLVPPVLAALSVWFFRRRRQGIATRLATRAMVVIGAGFAVLVVVSVHGILGTGYGEIRRRAVPAAVDLARTLSRSGAATDAEAAVQDLALFRARTGDVGPVLFWLDACGRECLLVSADEHQAAAARAWGYEHANDGAAGIQSLSAGGVEHFVVTSAVRDARGLPVGKVAVAVDAAWVHAQALQTGLLMVGLVYLLLGFTWWMTRRLVMLTVAQRVRLLADLVDSTGAALPVRAGSEHADDELAALATALRAHVTRSVAQVRDADRRLADARALTARMESTATLAAGVAHDFNNLMAGIMANSQVLQADVAGDSEARETLETIVDCAERGGKLAQQLLAFARGGKYNPVVVDLNRLIEDALRIEGPRGDDDVRRVVRLAPDLLRAHGDPTQLSQVVSNLVRNAAEAMAGAGTITVATANVVLDGGRSASLADLPAGPYIRLTVTDTGPGMSDETVARIFEPFFTTKDRGRGMGLAAAYGIVTHHGGQIEVTSAPGAGTTFTIYLPATEAAVPSLGAPTPRRTGASGTVLVVDDEAPILAAARRLLEVSGYEVLTATNGKEAVQLARSATCPIDVILLDMKMPIMNGPAAFPLLREAQPGARVILCSGYDLDAAARALLDAGAAAFVSKPFRIEYLLFEIDKAIAERAWT